MKTQSERQNTVKNKEWTKSEPDLPCTLLVRGSREKDMSQSPNLIFPVAASTIYWNRTRGWLEVFHKPLNTVMKQLENFQKTASNLCFRKARRVSMQLDTIRDVRNRFDLKRPKMNNPQSTRSNTNCRIWPEFSGPLWRLPKNLVTQYKTGTKMPGRFHNSFGSWLN